MSLKKNGKLLPLCLFYSCSAGRLPCRERMAQKEIALGQKVSADVEKQWERVADPALAHGLNMALNRMVPLSRPLPYEVRVVREDMVNTSAFPGIVYFTTGMLNFLRSDAEIAAILAHELIHADKRHVMIEVARSSKISPYCARPAYSIPWERRPDDPHESRTQVAVTNSYSKDLERGGQGGAEKVLIRAGYPPSCIVTSLEAMIHDQLKRPYVDGSLHDPSQAAEEWNTLSVRQETPVSHQAEKGA